MTTPNLDPLADVAEKARRQAAKVCQTWSTVCALEAIRDVDNPHTEAHRRFCNAESEFRSVIDVCKEPHFQPEDLNPLIEYWTKVAQRQEAHREDLIDQVADAVEQARNQEEKALATKQG